ncbi:MAG: hypothetical protein LBE91_19625 [Tannerella sp.]|jgi:ABC-type oligopeptide transport system substrate-binding subunit|nr:hypothetical protein [Tannerella sp.]
MMKRINFILAALFLLLSAGQLQAQSDKAALPYRPAASFNGDTLRYLDYNYRMRGEQYVGKTVGEILEELEYPVLYIADAGLRSSPSSPTVVYYLSLSVRQIGKKASELKDYYIVVRFENPPTSAEYRKASEFRNENGDPVFTQKLYDFLKDRKVTGIGVNPYMYMTKEPVTSKKMKEIREKNDREAREKINQEERKNREN